MEKAGPAPQISASNQEFKIFINGYSDIFVHYIFLGIM